MPTRRSPPLQRSWRQVILTNDDHGGSHSSTQNGKLRLLIPGDSSMAFFGRGP